jgi:hypothetical protein
MRVLVPKDHEIFGLDATTKSSPSRLIDTRRPGPLLIGVFSDIGARDLNILHTQEEAAYIRLIGDHNAARRACLRQKRGPSNWGRCRIAQLCVYPHPNRAGLPLHGEGLLVLFAFDRDRRESGKAECLRPCGCYVNNAPPYKGTPVVDRDHH